MYMYYKATENTLCGAGILLNPFDPGLVSTDICSHGGRPWKKEQKTYILQGKVLREFSLDSIINSLYSDATYHLPLIG